MVTHMAMRLVLLKDLKRFHAIILFYLQEWDDDLGVAAHVPPSPSHFHGCHRFKRDGLFESDDVQMQVRKHARTAIRQT